MCKSNPYIRLYIYRFMINPTDAKRKKKGDNTFFSNVSKRKRKTNTRQRVINFLNDYVLGDGL